MPFRLLLSSSHAPKPPSSVGIIQNVADPQEEAFRPQIFAKHAYVALFGMRRIERDDLRPNRFRSPRVTLRTSKSDSGVFSSLGNPNEIVSRGQKQTLRQVAPPPAQSGCRQDAGVGRFESYFAVCQAPLASVNPSGNLSVRRLKRFSTASSGATFSQFLGRTGRAMLRNASIPSYRSFGASRSRRATSRTTKASAILRSPTRSEILGFRTIKWRRRHAQPKLSSREGLSIPVRLQLCLTLPRATILRYPQAPRKFRAAQTRRKRFACWAARRPSSGIVESRARSCACQVPSS